MTRKYCPQCSYPKRTCICDHIRPIDCSTRFHILQHPLESKAAKNSAKLVTLCLPNAKVWVGETAKDFDAAQHALEADDVYSALIYPAENAQTISLKGPRKSLYKSNSCSEAAAITDIVLIDATWRKAYKMWKTNPWLSNLPSLKFENIESVYNIRQTSVVHGLSTLECVYHYLRSAEPTSDASPLIIAFQARQAFLAQDMKSSDSSL